jgi:hypothetical protein
MSDNQPATNVQTLSSRKIKGGLNRAYIIARLQRQGACILANKVISGEISAAAAARQAGFNPPRETLRKGEHKLTATEWQRWLRYEQQRIAQTQHATKPEPTQKNKIDVAALIG